MTETERLELVRLLKAALAIVDKPTPAPPQQPPHDPYGVTR